MKNYVQEGEKITVTASADVQSGDVFQVESLNGVFLNSAKNGESVPVLIDGVVELAKDTGAIGLGKKVYIDSNGKATETSATNKLFGICVEAAKAADPTVRVKIIIA